MANLSDTLPPPEESLGLPPEELAYFVLKHLSRMSEDNRGKFNRLNITINTNVVQYSG